MDQLDGQQLEECLTTAISLLQRYRDAINSLNVFPVPDGDTGTNMLLTMQSTQKGQTALTDSISIHSVAQEASHKALWGARGNSGVILSQFLSGVAHGLANLEISDPKTLAGALTYGSTAAYSAVSQPVEGTMLTVIRAMSSAAQEEATKHGADIIDVFRAALKGAQDALDKTPEQLPILAEAGVVDAGGQGIVVIMSGILGALEGKGASTIGVNIGIGANNNIGSYSSINQDFLKSTQNTNYGYCTQFMLEGPKVNLDHLREGLHGMGDSIVVVGETPLAKIHIHASDPENIIEFARNFGDPSHIEIDNINKQHQEFTAFHKSTSSAPNLGIVAITSGSGFETLFRDLGCHATVPCDWTMNPSTQEILEAADRTGALEVAILCNDPNAVMTVNQASTLSQRTIHCLPTSNMPEGVASVLAYSPDIAPHKVLKSMDIAIKRVRVLEITTAVRDSQTHGTRVSRGDFIGLYGGKIISSGNSIYEVLEDMLMKADLTEGDILTFYWGGATTEPECNMAIQRLGKLLPNQEMEPVFGGQPFQHYIVSIE